MSWNLGRPVFGRLPACYRNDNNGENPSNWLTRYWDEILVEVKFRAENFYELYLNPATAPEEWLDGMVAPLCGFTEEYYRPEWDLAIKRKLCLSAYGYIWPNRGAGHVLDWMLDLHQIDTFPEPHAYYKPEWLRVHDRIRTLTQDLDSTGTPAEFLGRIAEAIEVDATIDGDRVILPITDDDWYYHDTAYAIQLHRLPFELEYDRFQLDLSRLGDGLHEGDPIHPTQRMVGGQDHTSGFRNIFCSTHRNIHLKFLNQRVGKVPTFFGKVLIQHRIEPFFVRHPLHIAKQKTRHPLQKCWIFKGNGLFNIDKFLRHRGKKERTIDYLTS